ncbi:MAG TPA: hypothetical protein VFA74_05700 [Terriglobales bacterium]|nr:hypothetical protein [Terriglobales bacterium]
MKINLSDVNTDRKLKQVILYQFRRESHPVYHRVAGFLGIPHTCPKGWPEDGK